MPRHRWPGTELRRRRRRVLRRAHPDSGEGFGEFLCGQIFQQICLDQAGRNRVDANPFGRQFLSRGACHADEGRLGGAVDNLPLLALSPIMEVRLTIDRCGSGP